MKLVNNMTNLSNQDIGQLLDNIKKNIDTIYYGKVQVFDFSIYKRKFRCQIRYLKRYTRFDIWEEKE